ncbi:MAG: hypothetical protein JSV23_03335 [Promethearchaeota archaeon]|nr:MAG: hypothetical protein JSV23_03335 [Candidatus Lokiarchaeota archaeon]
MVNIRKNKTLISILSIFIIGIYIFFSASIYSTFFSIDTVITQVIDRLTIINYFSLGIAQIFSLLVIPTTTIILLNVKELKEEKRYLVSRILVAISMPVILINIILFNFYYWVFAIFYQIELLIWGPFIGFALFYLIEFLLSLMVFLLLRTKSEEK